MAFYLLQGRYSQEGIQALVANPQDRRAAVARLIEAVGGKLHAYFFAFGDYDAVFIIEAPDNVEVAAAVMTALAAGGVARVKTTPLLTWAEGLQAMQKAGGLSGSWTRPGG